MLQRTIFSLFLISCIVLSAQTNLNYYLSSETKYNSAITTPYDYFGFQPGEMHLRHDQLISYAKHLMMQTDKMKMEQYATSYENRPLYLIAISSKKNIDNLEKIRQEHLLLSDPSQSQKQNIKDMPVIVWLGFSVHGNEASGGNSVPILLYHLIAAEGREFEDLLAKMIILIDPCINPDGFDRFANWANINRSRTLNTDPNNREHQEYWPGGRGNHYWFDMNRDWLLLQHPESKGRVKKFHEWKPNVLTDHHEMGGNSTFFFQPGVVERNNPLTPNDNFLLTSKIAKYHAEALDKIGSLYFSKETFDDFYFGKGSSYPDINGSIGILFEQAGVRGIARENDNGILTFSMAIKNQLTTALSTIKASLGMKDELLNYQRNFYLNQIEKARTENVRAYIVSLSEDKFINKEFFNILNQHQVKMYLTKKEVKTENYSYPSGKSIIIPIEQPSFGLIKSFFEKTTQFKDSIFYDISAWNLPYAFNLQYSELTNKTFSKDFIGNELTNYDLPSKKFTNNGNCYAYAFEWSKYYSPKLLNKLLSSGIIVKVATLPFSSQTDKGIVQFSYGSIVIPIGIQRNKISLIEEILKNSEENDIEVHSILTGLSESGIDLGSSNFRTLKKPTVMLLVGPGVSSLDAGEIWHLMDQRMEMSLSIIELRNLSQIDFNKYSTIIMTGGSYREIDSLQTDRLRRWTQQGGTLISTGTAADWLIRNKFTKEKTIDFRNVKSDSTIRKLFVERSKEFGALAVPGAIFEAELDITNPIGYGYKDKKLYMFMSGDIAFKPSKDSYSTPLQYTKEPLVSGFISKRIYNSFKNSASIVTDRLGRGNIILMTEGPNYRAFWYSTNKLLMNSIFFGSLLGSGGGERED